MNEARVRKLYEQALDLPPDDRPIFLQRECRGEAEVRQRVEALLEAHEEVGGFLAEPTAGAPASEPLAPEREAPGSVIGNYKLLQQVGEGGMGTVWMAEQFEPVRRKVALKIIKLGMDTKQVIVRFEAERQALALMDHPNIAKVLDGGVTESGRPYFVMELVKGIPITEFCDEAQAGHPRSPRRSSCRSARRSSTPTRRGSSTATSSRPTSSSRCTTASPSPR